jgi:hypothetical protein
MASKLRFTEPANNVIPKNKESASDIVPKNVDFGPKFKKAARNERAVAAIRTINGE